MIIGYARVSTQDQQTLRQIDQLKEFGCERIYEEMDVNDGKMLNILFA